MQSVLFNTVAGVHKLGLFYWAFVNHDASKRMALHNIHLATVALESDISYYGIEQIVSGPPGEPSTGSSIGASLRELDTGVHIKIDGKENTLPATYVRGWLILVAAEYPAAALMTVTTDCKDRGSAGPDPDLGPA